LAIALPFVWGEYPVLPALPSDVAALQAPDKVNIVAFTDFECPFCRKLHPTLAEARRDLGDRCNFTRKMVPLAGHPGAMPAALAYCCVPNDKKDRMAEALYAAPEDELTREGTIAIATGLGVDADKVRAGVA